MGKLRVYELAKELNLESKAVINWLSNMGIEVKNHMSTLEDDLVEKLRERARGGNKDKATEPARPAQTDQRSKPVQQGTHGGNQNRPQGATQGGQPGGYQNRPQGDRPQGGFQNRPQGAPQGGQPGGYQNRPQGDRPQGGFQNRPQGAPQGGQPGGYQNRPQGDRPQGVYQNRPQGAPQGGQQGGYQNRPQGDRPQGGYQNRPQGGQGTQGGGYQNRPQGGQGGYQNKPQGGQGGYQNRPQGGQGGYQSRPQGSQGGYDNRPQGGQGGYQNRPQGGQGGYDNRPQGGQGGYQNRPQGGQGGYQNRPQGGGQGGYQNRPQGGYQNRPQGGQGGYQNRPQGNRPQGGGANRGPGHTASSEVPQPERREQRPTRPNDRTNVRSDRKGQRQEQQLLEKAKGGYNRQKRGRFEPAAKAPDPTPREQKPIVIGETITVKDLAERMKKQASELIKKLLGLGVLVTINQEIDSDTAEILANEFGFKIDVQIEKTDEEILEEYVDDPKDLEKRPCVVTVMGHVDHGKTSLLDAIRSTNVIATEAGGITQHIGAYQVERNGRKITFLDTPGHEAFTAMRARGASITDVAILVVAADDGVMPQTIEAIAHAKAAEVPIIVAINKMDKPGANPDRVKQELTEHGLVSEEWGGETICVNVSAKAREHIDDLLEMILLVTDMQDLKANKNRPGKGTVVEAELDKGRGPVATVLVQNGTLQIGDAIVAGAAFGKVRAMIDDKGRRIKKAGPSTPVEVLGLSDVPEAGDLFYVIDDEKKARHIAERRTAKRKEEEVKTHSKITLEDLFEHIKEGEIKELNIIIKADVQGSVEAVKQSLAKLSTDEVRVNTIHGGVGAITESDVMLGSASNAIIIGFNVRPDNNARKAAEVDGVDIRLYRVIYNAIEDVKAAMSGLLDPDIKEVIQGRVEVRTIFKASKVGTIAGCYVLEGKVTRDSKVRVIRDSIVIHEGQLDSLKRFKDDAKEVLQGFECGITIEKFNEIQEGDVIEAFTMEEVKREL